MPAQSKFPDKPFAGVFKTEMPVEIMRSNQPFIAGYLDHPAARVAQAFFGGRNQRAANALSSKFFGDLQDREPADRPWTMDCNHDVKPA